MNHKKIGITGGIGSGKSLVCSIIKAMGYPIFNADEVAKQVLNTNSEVIFKIKSLFGNRAYKKNTLDSSYIASIVFNDSSKLELLNKLIHPKVRDKFTEFVKNTNTTFFYEAAIIFESERSMDFDAVILVKAPLDLRINRVIKRDGSTKEDILKRINKQWTDDQKEKLTPYCINNDEDSPLINQIEQILSKLCIS